MRQLAGKRYWLVGASEGLGRALAHKLSSAGAEVIVSARSAERLADLVAELPGPARAVACDVGDQASVERAAAEAGEIDGMVYLAGVYWPVKASEWNTEHALAMCDINLMGAIRVSGAVVPSMLARGAGHIVLTGSLSGFRGLPGAIGYGASKAGIMSLAETMYSDLRNTGVDVQLANPGFVRTRLTDKNDFSMPFIMEPEDAAEEMMKLMRSNRVRLSFPFLFSLFFRASRFLPERLYQRLLS